MKSLLRYCVRRPLGLLAIYSGASFLGLFAWFHLPQELMPDLQFPQLAVVTLFPNASPEEVENLVTKPIEQTVGTVKNVRRVESSSKEQMSVVTVEFRWDTDMDAALLGLQEKIGLVQDQLPLEAKKPLVSRYNPFDRPIVRLNVAGALPLQNIDHVVRTRLVPALEKTPGVSAVQLSGGLEREIKIDLDAERLSAHRLPIVDVAEALRQRNVSRSAGSATEGLFEYPITITGSFQSVDNIGESIVHMENLGPAKSGESSVLRLNSVGKVTDGFRERGSVARFDGQDTLSLSVFKRSETYPIEAAKAIRQTIDDLRRQLPPDVNVHIIDDQSTQIDEGITDVFGNVVLGGLLTYLVIWAFLKSQRRSIIVGLTIPLALFLTVTAFWRMDLSINLLTLGGLALGVGMLVDAAVVFIENISRHMDMGKSLENGIVDGADEVGGAVFYSHMTTIAAFAPIPFASVGVAQKVFAPICLAVILSQIASLVVGFTFVPALCALALEKKKFIRLITDHDPAALRLGDRIKTGTRRLWEKTLSPARRRTWAESTARLQQGWETVQTRFFDHYERALRASLVHSRRVLTIVIGLTVFNGILLFFIRRETMPTVDESQFLMKITLPVGSRLEVTDETVQRIEEELTRLPEVAHRNVVIGSSEGGGLGPHEAQVMVALADRVPRRDKKGAVRGYHRRRRTARDLIKILAEGLKKRNLEGARVEYEVQGSDVFSQLFGKAGADFVIEVKGADLDNLKTVVSGLQEKIQAVPGVGKVENSVPKPSLQTRYEMDEPKLARDGLSVSEVAETVLAGLHGTVPTHYREKGREIPLRVRLREEDRKDISALSRLVLTNPVDRVGHPLSEYGRLEITPGPSEIRRRDQSRALLLSVTLAKASLDDVLPRVKKILRSYRQRRDVIVELGGEVEEMKTSFNSLLFGFAAATVLVYIVLVAQFNTLWVPLLAMVSVPLAVNGVTPALLLTGHSLNLMSGQGLMILSGIVVNNSLMLLEFIGQRREEGKSPEEAALEASHTRLRPIFMTVIGTVAGLFPLALGIGRGAQLQAPMAVTVIFGLLVSTVLTLVVMPALYLQARAYFEKQPEVSQ